MTSLALAVFLVITGIVSLAHRKTEDVTCWPQVESVNGPIYGKRPDGKLVVINPPTCYDWEGGTVRTMGGGGPLMFR